MLDLSVIMPCFLGHYPRAASDRPAKLERAVRSYLESEGEFTAELIIVADGCADTVKDWERRCRSLGVGASERVLEPVFGRRMRLVEIEKQPMFSGEVRNAGIRAAEGEVVAYLDSDDYVTPEHFQTVVAGMRGHDWAMFNDILHPCHARFAEVSFGCCGTSTTAHRRELEATWPNGYGHDYEFILSLSMLYPNWANIGQGGYVVCHVPQKLDV